MGHHIVCTLRIFKRERLTPFFQLRTGSPTTTDAWVESSVLHCYTLECPTTYHPQFNWIKQETLQTPNWIFWSPRFCGSTGLRHWRYFFRSTGGPCRNLFGSWFVSEMGTPRKPFGDHQMNIDESYSRTFPIEIIRNDDQVCLPMTKRVHGRCENEMFLLWNAT